MGTLAKVCIVVFLLLSLPLGIVHSDSMAMQTTRYSVVVDDRVAGLQESFCEGAACRFSFSYNNRGRGPHLVSRIDVDGHGIPTHIETTGHDYYGKRVNEQFRYQPNVAAWRNREESNERQVQGNAFYVSVNSVPAEAGLLAKALLAAPGGKLPLLPEGEARIERMTQLRVSNATGSQTVVLYAISGLDFEDSPVWLDQDNNLFGVMRSNLSVVREGWESAVDDMRNAQEDASTAHTTQLARSLAHKPAGPLVIQNANVFDAETAQMRPNTTVVVEGNRIAAVGPDGSVAIPENAEFINASGKSLIPGLWDMHAHLTELDGPLNLAAGITTARDLGNPVHKVLDLKSRFESGEALGPRVLLAGLMDAPVSNHGPTDVFVDNATQARAAVDRFARLGYEEVKVYSSINPDLIPVIAAQARKDHLRLSGHIPAFTTAETAVREGLNEIHHIDYLLLNFLSRYITDTSTPARFTTVVLYGNEVDLHSTQFDNFVALMKQKHVVIDPTLNIFENMLNQHAGDMARGFVPVADRLPPQVRRGVLVPGMPMAAGMSGRYHATFDEMLRLVHDLYAAGVTIVAGTDSMGGFPLQRELELYVQAGIPAPEVLRIATLGAARVMHHDAELGSIAPGKLADLALVDGNPASNIGDIRRVVTTIKNGVVYQTASLYQAIGVAEQ